MAASTSILSVIGKDRPGIIAAVTEILFRQGCNLEDVSMTTLEGELAMMLVVTLPKKKQASIDRALQPLKRKMGLSFFWKEIRGRLRRGEIHPADTALYLITVAGRDRTGIVYRVSRCLAKFKINITDLNSKILGKKGKAVYVMVLEAEIPKALDLKRLESEFRNILSQLGVDLQLKPVEPLKL